MNANVFVYGTLKTGGNLWSAHLDGKVGTPDKVDGFALYQASSWFPAMVEGDAGQVVMGEVMADLPDATIKWLDRVEGVPDLYQRRKVVTLGGVTAWVYTMRDLPRDARMIRDGVWRSPTITVGLHRLAAERMKKVKRADQGAVAKWMRDVLRPLAEANGVHLPWRTGPNSTEWRLAQTYLAHLATAADIGL